VVPVDDLDELFAGGDILQAALFDHLISLSQTPTIAHVTKGLGALVARFLLERPTQAIRSGVLVARFHGSGQAR
jgi:hypothetical protein